ncbi:unnamed protein product [Sphagnum jensenii]|uniref:NADH dehydrogenase subunit 6 n=1 Tax=Sphagnum jensenii TaxID=128206 RepID=A0ABP1B4U4_9BRYO
MTLIFAQSLFFLSSAVPFVCCLLLCFFPLVGCWVLLYSHPPSPFPKPTHPATRSCTIFTFKVHLTVLVICCTPFLRLLVCLLVVLGIFLAAVHFSFCGGGAAFFFFFRLFVCLLLQCKFSLTFGGGFYLSFSSEVVLESRSPAEF